MTDHSCSAVGDIHGDLRKAISSLEAARVLQEVAGQVRWAGGDTVVVQLGDVLDRGDSEIGTICWHLRPQLLRQHCYGIALLCCAMQHDVDTLQ